MTGDPGQGSEGATFVRTSLRGELSDAHPHRTPQEPFGRGDHSQALHDEGEVVSAVLVRFFGRDASPERRLRILSTVLLPVDPPISSTGAGGA